MALVLGKKSNTADGRFGRALRGLQRFPISALASLAGQPARLRKAALISESAEGHDCMDAGGRATQEAKAAEVILY